MNPTALLRLLPATKARILVMLKERPMAVEDMADALGITRQAIHYHLAPMISARVLIRQDEHSGHRGRPRRLYRLSPEAARCQ